MPFTFEKTPLVDVIVITPTVFPDERGFFMETFREDFFREAGLPTVYVQDNHSSSRRGVVRGLHFQWDPPMAKLMRVTYGAAFLVAVDIRKGSPQFGQWYGVEISAENKKQLYAPAGFARGFCVLSEGAELQYKCTGIYNSRAESGILWNDPEVGIEWPVADPILSEKDRNAQTLAQWAQNPLSDRFTYP
jgi:dTDP-4-dehydrorhamnose 3,5-epimerase